ncbi:MAG: helix-turn-helix domain-containing protein [Clostridiales bacterium]|nr:helix-turn-helix domain-containing protein [Clostridiales bacterium]
MSIEERARQLNNNTFDKKSYSVEEAANALGVTRQTVYKLINQGCFKAIKIERNSYRIIKKSFDEWLDEA